ncbi:protein-disulfide reductase DsbD domain-containing protein [Rhodovulum sp. DZ06]|uniref:protein-disulfide reductase DsbD domain-containing protein n=1 Tax=Rhodovulum sp. DZ06 TaxID=3425126 RepID=UPI003D354A28
MNRTYPALLIACAAAAPALAAGPGPRADAGLLPGWQQEDGARLAGLRIALAPGWKTYWRNPGDAGIPPRFDWSGSSNVADVQVLWPRPHAFEAFGYRTIGYKEEVTLPLRVTPVDPAQPIALRLSMEYGVCSDICVPEAAELAIDIAPGETGGEAPIRAAWAARILPAAEAGLSVERCTIAGAGLQRRFEGRFRAAAPFTTPPVVVVEAGEDVWIAPAEVTLDGDAILAGAEVELLSEDQWVDRDSIDVTLLGDDQAMVAFGCR